MKNFMFLLLIGFGTIVFAQSISFLDEEEKITEETYDFGFIEKGGKAEATILVKNTGDKPLVVTKAQPSCGCTVPEAPKEPIMPGETAKMKVKYTTTSKVGKFTKTITVYSNAVGKERTVFRIKGEIIEPS